VGISVQPPFAKWIVACGLWKEMELAIAPFPFLQGKTLKGATKMQNKLKPCPFCGEAATMHTASQKEEYKACCKDLTCIGSYIYLWHPTKEKAAEFWNRRAGNEQAD
jgi:Lar family restriction alleviation protein